MKLRGVGCGVGPWRKRPWFSSLLGYFPTVGPSTCHHLLWQMAAPTARWGGKMLPVARLHDARHATRAQQIKSQTPEQALYPVPQGHIAHGGPSVNMCQVSQWMVNTVNPHSSQMPCYSLNSPIYWNLFVTPKSILRVLFQSFEDMCRTAKILSAPSAQVPSWGWTRRHSAFWFQLLYGNNWAFLWSTWCHVFHVFALFGDLAV